jgi:hypothetical protein
MPTTAELVAELKAITDSSEALHARRSEIVRELNVAVGPVMVSIVDGTLTLGGTRVTLSEIPTSAIRKLAAALVAVANKLDAGT